jgi:ATP-dependent RNA helicase DHX29
VKRSLEDPEKKAIARLGITYGVLRRLGFSEARVEECLRSIQSVDLDEAYEWVSHSLPNLFSHHVLKVMSALHSLCRR